ncbi:hypothetical protein I316_05225 [Kwoniella heveanensis BCC8398]|uniref:KOW domain-containing protein n=1 Tax=Kwoniella heveanensis BCC8398 TaxID=1296120 RepID=A0A1B9GQ38_9TREE|nr:hypothetical protein I316_05225 [Kwoniella heveanensis BCC8398]
MSGEPISRLPRGLQHLVNTKSSKFAGRLPSRLPHATTKFVQPRDRVKKWNIRPGDRVRLTVGTPVQKFLNEEDSSEGWKTYKVKQIDMERNRVFLEGVNNVKTNVIHKFPKDFDSLTEQHKQSYTQQKNFQKSMRPVHYSNVQLCLENRDGADSLFATRIKTANTHFNVSSQRLEWRRFAAKISGGPVPDSWDKVPLVYWPKPDKKYQLPDPNNELDTTNSLTRKQTLVLSGLQSIIGTTAADMFPQHINAPPPSDAFASDQYIHQTNGKELDRSNTEDIDMLMPLYLSEELSPRFARMKTYKAYRARREAEELERDAVGKDAVDAWEAGGRDKGLREAMELEQVGLEGVFLKPRTRKEVREAAVAEYDVENEAMRQEVNMSVREGKLWDAKLEEWVDGPKAERIARRRARKARKESKVIEKLARLQLQEDENTVLPKAA